MQVRLLTLGLSFIITHCILYNSLYAINLFPSIDSLGICNVCKIVFAILVLCYACKCIC